MSEAQIETLIERVREWPSDAQDELVRVVAEIESRYSGVYQLDEGERAALRRSQEDIEGGRFASDAEMDAVLRPFSPRRA